MAGGGGGRHKKNQQVSISPPTHTQNMHTFNLDNAKRAQRRGWGGAAAAARQKGRQGREQEQSEEEELDKEEEEKKWNRKGGNNNKKKSNETGCMLPLPRFCVDLTLLVACPLPSVFRFFCWALSLLASRKTARDLAACAFFGVWRGVCRRHAGRR